MTVLLDTSILCALFDEQDAHHEEAVRLLHTVQGAHVLIPCIVIAELLAGEVPGERILRQCTNFASAILPDTEQEIALLATFSTTAQKGLKANDCLILAHSLKQKAELLTFDQKLLKAYKQLQR
jgi:predicted nucleic acid-binding protein